MAGNTNIFPIHRSASERHASLPIRPPGLQHSRTRSAASAGNKDLSSAAEQIRREMGRRVRSVRLKSVIDRQHHHTSAEGSSLFDTEWLTAPEHPSRKADHQRLQDDNYSPPVNGTSPLPRTTSSSRRHRHHRFSASSEPAKNAGASPQQPNSLPEKTRHQQDATATDGYRLRIAGNGLPPPPPSRAHRRHGSYPVSNGTINSATRHYQLQQQASRLQELEFRVNQLEQQNKILLAALFSAPRTNAPGVRVDAGNRSRQGSGDSTRSATEPKLEPSPLSPSNMGHTRVSPIRDDGGGSDDAKDKRSSCASLSSESVKQLKYLMLDFDID